MKAFIDKIQNDENFVQKWIKLTKAHIKHPQKATKELVALDEVYDISLPEAA
ncbi:hypothetical protein WDW89_00265 [Deltaproteobacteria bacterium TL4]